MPVITNLLNIENLPNGNFFNHFHEVLENFEQNNDIPLLNGFEDLLRNFVVNELNHDFPNLKNGSRIYFGENYQIDDFSFTNDYVENVAFLRKRKNGENYGLQSLFEWGHDHAHHINGCVNKPLKDFIKWRRLAHPYNQFNRVPLFCVQIVTDINGLNGNMVNQIQACYQNFNSLRGKWTIEYENHPTRVYLFLNYFPIEVEFNNFLQYLTNNNPINNNLVNNFEQNLAENYNLNPNWPLGNLLNIIING